MEESAAVEAKGGDGLSVRRAEWRERSRGLKFETQVVQNPDGKMGMLFCRVNEMKLIQGHFQLGLRCGYPSRRAQQRLALRIWSSGEKLRLGYSIWLFSETM